MNELKIWNYESSEIRTVEVNGEPWFVGKDVADILGYTNTPKAIRDHIDDEDKLTERIVLSGQNREVIFINESGLYSLILSSKLPTAKKFKHWVTNEVLPSIRKHGAYMTEQTLEKALLSPDYLIQLATQLKKEQAYRKQLEQDNILKQQKIEEDKPKVLFAEAVSVSKTSILVGDLAKILKQNGVDIGQNRLFKWLRENGYLIRRKGESYNMPTQSSLENGWFEIKESTGINPDGSIRISKTTKVTGKGQQYFINKFLRNMEESA